MEMKIYTMKTLSGLHCGIGQGLSDIDLPTARDSVSGYPIVPGSSVKGVLREFFDDQSEKFLAGFGDEAGKNTIEFASALSFTDARLICLPARSYFGTFAYLASPYSLGIVQQFLKQQNQTAPLIPSYPAETNCYRASIPKDSKLISIDQLAERILLEDLDLFVDEETRDMAEKWAEQLSILLTDDETNRKIFTEHFAIVDDNVLAFLCETALPVAAHTRISPTGVVEPGALWYEEFVPPEALFIGAVYGDNGRGKYNEFKADALLDFVCSKPVDCQIGGNATTGRGLVSINFS